MAWTDIYKSLKILCEQEERQAMAIVLAKLNGALIEVTIAGDGPDARRAGT